MLQGNVLITGGAGFLGRAIMRRAQRELWPCKFTVFSRSERTQVDTSRQFPNARYVLGDVCDTQRLAIVAVGHDTIIHAAALKFIPEGEFNAGEVVRVNIDGSRSIIDVARYARANLVGISTDKAAAPVNIYGMTKAVMERLFCESGFNTCRYGNVLGSTGSVVPVMQRQLAEKGYVVVTDPYMTRFWMRADDAVDTIIHTLSAPARTVTVPNPRSASMHALAHAVIDDDTCTWGAVNKDLSPCHYKIRFVGPRPGEKLHEDLITMYERPRTTQNGDYFYIGQPGSDPGAKLDQYAGVSSSVATQLTHDELVRMVADAKTITGNV